VLRTRVLALIAVVVICGGLCLSTAAAGPARSAGGTKWAASTPSVAGAPLTSLAGVTCVSSSDCWAVGDRFRSSSAKTGPALIERYTGHAWTPMSAAPAQAGTLDELSGVSCLSSADCWAVGMRSGSRPGNLVEHYGNGTRWTMVGTPGPEGELSAVTCEPSVGQCWTVGSSSDFRRAITFRLAGGRWSYVSSAPLQASFVQVGGVACATADDCLLVGFVTPKHGSSQALAERWNGRNWSRVAVAGQLAGGGSLAGVDCRPGTSPTMCWAVGQTVGKGSGLVPIHPLVERWNGHSFALVNSPLGGPGNYPELKSVSCGAPEVCQAVGSRGSGEDEASVLTQGWNGSAWSRESSRSPMYGFQTLAGVSCPTAQDCWAVGEGQNRSFSGVRLIIEHFTAGR
jgi:hypothetical protein